ncbi:MAG: hypothetical protein QNJ29_03605 [Rhizobiaceae bacterium]|nr:hypothetical protein [Rhizobiaceae bacterium]
MKQTPEETEAQKILDRVANDSETVGTSSMRRVAERMKGHVSAEDADQNDWAEKWGTRIGRILGLIFVIALVTHLLRTYVLNG